MADYERTGQARCQAGRLSSFKEACSDNNKRIYIANKTFAEWRTLRSQLHLCNDDKDAKYLLNRHQLESRNEDGQLRLEYTV